MAEYLIRIWMECMDSLEFVTAIWQVRLQQAITAPGTEVFFGNSMNLSNASNIVSMAEDLIKSWMECMDSAGFVPAIWQVRASSNP